MSTRCTVKRYDSTRKLNVNLIIYLVFIFDIFLFAQARVDARSNTYQSILFCSSSIVQLEETRIKLDEIESSRSAQSEKAQSSFNAIQVAQSRMKLLEDEQASLQENMQVGLGDWKKKNHCG